VDIDPATLTADERYRLLTGAVVPRPIAFVSTLSVDGVANLAPYSFFTGAGAAPLSLVFCPTTRDDGSDKDTLRNLLTPAEGGRGEFVVNTSSVAHAKEINAAAASLPADESEFGLTGLTPAPSRVVASPRVAEAALSFECRTLQVVRLAPGVPASGVVVIGEVVHVWAREGVVDERYRVSLSSLDPLGRLAGGAFVGVPEPFQLPRGEAALRSEVVLPTRARGPSR
jgi:flavin reductase (DIM6/NTAB) family NADH-FMN oxidoreductase RutF